MTKTNLENFNNIYANLAESAYTGRPNSFPSYALNKNPKELDYSQNKIIKDDKGDITSFTKGGSNLPEGFDKDGNKKNGIVYLQPDKTLENKTEYYIDYSDTDFFGNPQAKKKNSQKGLLTDEKAGFNAYFIL